MKILYTGYMQCPTGDGELIAHTTHGENNLTVSYSTCPTCHGHWMNSFAANFIKLTPDDLQASTKPRPPSRDSEARGQVPHPSGVKLNCPVCQKTLSRATGDNIPDTVWVYHCPDHHGYFFPAGELAAFKKAQKTKIEYHKLWNLPLPSVASVLLAGFLFLVVGGGLVATLVALQNQQVTSSQAQEIIVSHQAIPDQAEKIVLISAETSMDVNIILSIPKLNNYEAPMISRGNHLYTTTLTNILPGSYTYRFTITTNGKSIRSQMYTFIMP